MRQKQEKSGRRGNGSVHSRTPIPGRSPRWYRLFPQFEFGILHGKQVGGGSFDGGDISSDGRVLLEQFVAGHEQASRGVVLVRQTCRKVWLQFASSCPVQHRWPLVQLLAE